MEKMVAAAAGYAQGTATERGRGTVRTARGLLAKPALPRLPIGRL